MSGGGGYPSLRCAKQIDNLAEVLGRLFWWGALSFVVVFEELVQF